MLFSSDKFIEEGENMDNLLAMINGEVFSWVIIPLLIFLGRIIDVTLGTIRIIMVSRGLKYLAPIFGFFEILVWLIALGQIMNNLSNPLHYVAYAGGFAAGNFVGIYIADKLALGTVCVRLITTKDIVQLKENLTTEHFGYTIVEGEGTLGKVHVIFTIIKKKNLMKLYKITHKSNPEAFISIEEIQSVEKGIFPVSKPTKKLSLLRVSSRPGK